MDRTEKVLSIIDKLLTLVENKDLDEKLDKWVTYMCTDEDWEPFTTDDNLEDWEEITEVVKDNSPSTLKEENEHLKNLVDMICDTFWLEQYETNWKLWVAWDKGLIEEIAKARKKLK